MTLSVGPVTDYLVALAAQAVDGLTVGGEAFQVVDGQPDQLTRGMFVIGVTEPPPNDVAETVMGREFVGLPANHVEDDFTIPCYIHVIVPGTRDQKTPRDIAEAAFNGFWPLLKASLTLNGLLTTGNAAVSELTEASSNVGTAAEPGRRHVIRFGVHCMNRTT